jgi:hypothetical protein
LLAIRARQYKEHLETLRLLGIDEAMISILTMEQIANRMQLELPLDK